MNKPIPQCEAITKALTDAFKTLPMSDQLRLNEMLQQLTTCAFEAGKRAAAEEAR